MEAAGDGELDGGLARFILDGIGDDVCRVAGRAASDFKLKVIEPPVASMARCRFRSLNSQTGGSLNPPHTNSDSNPNSYGGVWGRNEGSRAQHATPRCDLEPANTNSDSNLNS